MTDHEQKMYDIAFGLHSRIPACCIRFFTDEWGWRRRSDDDPYVRAIRVSKFGYVPCPQCLATGNRVKIRICKRECGGDHYSDFMPQKEAV